MFRYYLILLLLISLLPPILCQNLGNLYDDDPTQRLPIGTERPSYGFVPVGGGGFQGARVEPPNWWVGLMLDEVEVMIYDESVGNLNPKISHRGVNVKAINRVENNNYLFLKLEISNYAQLGDVKIELYDGRGRLTKTKTWRLEKRQFDGERGIDNSDFIYLVMPDRFANGDPSNDSVDDMLQIGTNRDKMYFRHGGDLRGVIDHLDYIEELGATTLWLNPVLENDQAFESYHGYAITDFYNIDPRFGNNELYRELVRKCHDRGIKILMDMVHNHIGDGNWLFKDLPERDWINQWSTFQKTNYRATVLMDPYAAQSDKNIMSNAWFDNHMPDLNQKNERVARYLLQNNIWWMEYSGQDGYRVDTYAYPDQNFMSEWASAMKAEYGNGSFFGETWVHGHAVQAKYTQSNGLRMNNNSHLPAVTDFQLHYAIEEALTKPMGWTEGVSRIYYSLVQDFLYEDAFRNILFLDNHDTSRFLSVVGENKEKLRSGIDFLMTMRGIPMLYYGTEILLKNFSSPDGLVRQDFPGGWYSDRANKFYANGRTQQENDMYNYVKTLANYRKTNPVLHKGKLTQFVPQDGVYVYFRYNQDKTIMVIMNTNGLEIKTSTDRYAEFTRKYATGMEVVTQEEFDLTERAIILGAFETVILELKN